MSSLSTPDLRAPRALALATAVTAAVACGLLLAAGWAGLDRSLGDSDDALRLLRLRDLLAGEGWWDHRVDRIEPPGGGLIHWSRLLDGAMAGPLLLARAVFGAGAGERLFRAVWPLLWIIPVIGAALATARTLAGGTAVFLGAVMIAVSPLLFTQFAPGRIDHHNIQITMAAVSMAGAVAGGARGGLAAGLAGAVGLAVGVEALIFHALAGAAFALRWAADAREGAAARRYAAVLAPAAALLHLSQLPPAEWAEPACDRLGSNLLAGMALGSAGLFAAVRLASGRTPPVRLVVLSLIGLVAAGIYAALEPACLGGPLGAVDPRIRPVWLDHVDEVQTVFQDLARVPADVVVTFTPPFVGLLALLAALSRPELRRSPAWLTAGAFLLLAVTAQAAGSRMGAYALWVALPVTAAAAAKITEARFGRVLVPTLLAALLLAPGHTAAASAWAADRLLQRPAQAAGPPNRCTRTDSYAELARLPPGLVVSEVYLGSHIVALTPHGILAAPYHRMDRGLLDAAAVLGAPALEAEQRARALGVRYIVSCPANAGRAYPKGPDSLQVRIDAGAPPPWLRRVSAPDAVLEVYELRPAQAGRSDEVPAG